MYEYYAIRLALAASLLWLVNFDIPHDTRMYYKFMTAYQAMPQFLTSALWWRTTWMALDLAQVAIGWLVCRELFRLMTARRTFWWERKLVLMFAACFALAFVLLSWSWAPANTFQTWLSIRQYYRLALLVGWVSISAWYGFLRPLKHKSDTEPLVALWCVWLASQFAMSTAGASGLLWRFVDRSEAWYRLIGDVGMGAQIAAVLATALFLRRQKQHGYT